MQHFAREGLTGACWVGRLLALGVGRSWVKGGRGTESQSEDEGGQNGRVLHDEAGKNVLRIQERM